MPVTIIDTGGTTTTTTTPNQYTSPAPVTNFRWDKRDGILKWDKASDTEMAGGHYAIQYSDNSGTSWVDLVSVLHDTISGSTAQYQDTTGVPDRVYQIKKVTSEVNGSISSIYVGYDVEYENTTDRCYVMIYCKQPNLTIDSGLIMEASFDVASGITYANYKNKSIVPVLKQSVAIEPDSGLLIMPLIPSDDLTLPGLTTTVKYNITIKGRDGFKAEYTGKTVPKSASAWVRDLT